MKGGRSGCETTEETKQDWLGEGGRTGTSQNYRGWSRSGIGAAGKERVDVKSLKAKTGQQDMTGIDRDTLLYSLGNKRLETSTFQ